ncbi:MAG TPA: hypothetical protein VMA35_09345 [Candidatus Sulfopaludibacter sp.]|nr:hypothetical protein [Candidatus Sulfopaludibacter sp.]
MELTAGARQGWNPVRSSFDVAVHLVTDPVKPTALRKRPFRVS